MTFLINNTYRRIYDNIYGFIELTPLESEIIDTPYFQRLRHISQLGTVNYVFPSAEHTRFSHSLGVLYMMDKILTHLQKMNINEFKPSDIEKLRLAALLHDIGHYPYSHTIEYVYRHHLTVDAIKKGTKGSFNGHHERLGRHIVCKAPIIRDKINDYFWKEYEIEPIPGETVADDIGKIIRGRHKNTLFNQLMNSELDADRLDYLIRDTGFTGAKYGFFDIDQLIRHLFVYHTPEGPLLVVNKKGLRAVDNYLLSRYFMMSLILSNKTIASFEILVQTAYELILEEDETKIEGGRRTRELNPYSYEKILETSLTSDFFKFNDHYLFNRIYSAQSSENKYLSEISKMIIERKPLKQILLISQIKEFNAANAEYYNRIKELKTADDNGLMDFLNIGVSDWLFYKRNTVPMVKEQKIGYAEPKVEPYEEKDLIKIFDFINNELNYVFRDKSSLIYHLGKLELVNCGIFTTAENRDILQSKIYEILCINSTNEQLE